MIRILTLVMLLVSIGAIGLGRISPKDRGRTRASSRLLGVSTCYRGATSQGLHVFDLNDGPAPTIRLNPKERVDLATGSPWIDSWDQVQVAGRWTVTDQDGVLTGCGLSRIAYPSGQVLDRIPLDRYPITPPCWGAGTSARVFFVAGDGNLYRYDFEPIPGSGGLGLRKVQWEIEPPETPEPVLVDVTRPDGILSPDLLLATVPRRSPQQLHGESAEKSEIWWLRLSSDEQAIIDRGPVTTADPKGQEISRRRPTIGYRSDGTLWLAYLSWQGIAEKLSLRIVPVQIDEQSGTPSALNTSGINLAGSCLNHAPAFADGGNSLIVQTLEDRKPIPVHIPLPESPSPTSLAMALPLKALILSREDSGG